MNSQQTNPKTGKQYWDTAWSNGVRMRLPSGLFVSTRNIQRLLKKHVTPGMRYLEIGCAPGKMLAWVAKILKAEVCGIDYSERGMRTAVQLFDHLGISGDLRCEDVFNTSFHEDTFDFVFSSGVIEHFDDPRLLVEIHVKLLKPGGRALIAIPNLGGIYGHIQHFLDPDIMNLHNTEIMQLTALYDLAPIHMVEHVRSYAFGRPMAMFIPGKHLRGFVARGITPLLNVIGQLQPFDVAFLCPLLVVEMTRRN